MELSALPDDEMLMVLSFLHPKELLLTVRRVCRRLRDLALHPDLWRRIDLDPDCHDYFSAAVTLAPCAEELDLSYTPNLVMQAVGPLLVETSCAFESVTFALARSLQGVALPALIIKRQASLGRLRDLAILLDARASSCPGLPFLLKTVNKITGLVKLVLDLEPSRVPKDVWCSPAVAEGDASPTPASLLSLTILGRASQDPRLTLYYLDRHASTLRSVTLTADVPGLAEKLSRLPNLRELSCPQLSGMSALLQSSSLKSLTLTIDFESSGLPPKVPLAEATAYLRASTGSLTEINLYSWKSETHAEVANLVLALAGRAGVATRSVLERLTFNIPGDYERLFRKLQPLALSLPYLPRLRLLHVDGSPSADFLSAINPTMLPELRMLSMHCVGEPNHRCTHEWLHSPPVQDLVARCPELHLQIGSYNCDCRRVKEAALDSSDSDELSGDESPTPPDLPPCSQHEWHLGFLCSSVLFYPHVKEAVCSWCSDAYHKDGFKVLPLRD